jgi:hypothetical protein
MTFYEQTRFEDGYGVLKNVGAIKSIAVNVYGLNFPHSLNAIYVDDQGVEKEVFMGYLNYDGWAQLTWENPAYVQEVRARTMRIYPLYPHNSSYIKFSGFRIKRDGADAGNDFVTYFKDVKVIYDKAVLEPGNADVDDESEWNIRRDRENAKAATEMKNFGEDQVFRYNETTKQAPQATFSPTARREEEQE